MVGCKDGRSTCLVSLIERHNGEWLMITHNNRVCEKNCNNSVVREIRYIIWFIYCVILKSYFLTSIFILITHILSFRNKTKLCYVVISWYFRYWDILFYYYSLWNFLRWRSKWTHLLLQNVRKISRDTFCKFVYANEETSLLFMFWDFKIFQLCVIGCLDNRMKINF